MSGWPGHHWEWVKPAERERKKWNVSDLVKIAEVADRVANGRALARDVIHVRGEIWELRVTGFVGEYRVYFARIKDVHVLLALRGAHKTWRKARAADLDTAEKRLAQWRSQQPSE